MDETLAVFAVIGAACSGLVTFARKLIPPFDRWVASLTDDEKQAGMLWLGIFAVAAVTAWRIFQAGGLPADPAAAANLVYATVAGVVLTLTGQGGFFAATKRIGSRHAAGRAVFTNRHTVTFDNAAPLEH